MATLTVKQLLVTQTEQQAAILANQEAEKADRQALGQRLTAIEVRLAEIRLPDITTFEPVTPATPGEEI